MNEGWIDRFWTALEADPRSERQIVIAAGLGVNYLSQTRKRGTHPVSDKLNAILDVLGPEAALYVLTGLRITAEDQEFLALLATLDPDQKRKARDFFAAILQAGAAPPVADPPSSPPTSA